MCWIQITNSGQTPSFPEGHDFTTVPADADYKPGELLVRFASKPDGTERNIIEKRQILNSLGGATIKYNFKLPGLTLVKLPPGQTVKDALKTFNGTNGILYAEPNYKIRFGSTFPNDPYGPKPAPDGGDQWGLHNTGQTGGTEDADIDAPEAWDIHTGSSDIIVAVLDSGVDYNHPDLADNIWINPGEDHEPFGIVGPEDFDGVDDDNNTYVDDIRGWDFDVPEDNDPMDVYGHGTHVAGIIGAIGDNNEGVTGVCWNVKIMGLNISHYGTETWEIFVSQAIMGIQYAIGKGAHILNASWGYPTYIQSLKEAIEDTEEAGVLFVAIAHNNPPFPDLNNDINSIYPASYDCNNIISVLATNHDDSIWSGSHYGATSVDLGAPGSDILSCLPGGSYEYGSGTSMAAPHVSGAAALIWAANPQLTHLEVKDYILQSVDKLDSLDGLCVSEGRLNLYNALTYKPPLLVLTKNDNDVSCVVPGDYITYTISYANPPVGDPNYIGDVNDVVITDYLPPEVDYVSSVPEPNEILDSNTIIWNIGTLSAGDGGSVTLTVKVNECILGCGTTITNFCEAESDSTYNTAEANTPVCSASNPEPTCGAIVVDVGEFNLTWCPGLFVADVDGHEVYFGSDFNDVNDANNSDPNVYKGQVTVPCYTLQFNNLHLDTTYYWRIDEVNDPNVWKGGVWSFTTGNSPVFGE